MSEAEFRKIAGRVSNWGRRRDEDERATLNLVIPEVVKRAAGCVRHGCVFSLGLAFGADGPLPGAAAIRFNPLHYMSAIAIPWAPPLAVTRAVGSPIDPLAVK
jgi:hypothetical protein